MKYEKPEKLYANSRELIMNVKKSACFQKIGNLN